MANRVPMAPGQQRTALVPAKIAAPTLRTPILHRPRLYEQLGWALERRITLVSADAGFGKTTLLSGFLQASPRRALWYRLDPEDSDPATFLQYLLTALRRILHRRIRGDLALATSWSAAMRILLQALEQGQGDVVLVLDDYHLLRRSVDLSEGMTALISHLPTGVRLVILSRVQPDIPLARLRAAGEVAEFGAQDLRFTAAELRELLLGLHGLTLSEPTLHLLLARTEGWPAGVMLALHALRAQGVPEATQAIAQFSGTSREIYDYLAQEAFDRQSPVVQRFLRATAILSRFNADIAGQLRGTRGARAIIRHLETSHLFVVPLDQQRGWFRYHHLFQEFLQQRLTEDEPERIPDLHGRAAALWEARGETLEAMRHYAHGGRSKDVARLLAHEGEMLWVRGQFDTLWRWLQTIPGDVLERHPRLVMLKGLVLRHLGRMDEAVAAFEAARRGLGVAGDWEGEARTLNYLGQTFVWLADRTRLLDLAREIGTPGRFPPAGRARIYDLLGRVKEVEGDLPAAVETYRRGIAAARAAGDVWGEVRNARECAGVLTEIGEFAAALRVLREGLDRTRAAGWAHETGHFAADLARTLLGLGRWSEAEEALRGAEAAAREGPCRRLLVEILQLKGEQALKRGEAEGAHSCFEEIIQAAQEDPVRARLAACIGLSRALGDGPARDYAIQAVQLGEQIGPYHRGVALLNLGIVEGKPEPLVTAISLLREAAARPHQALAQLHLAALRRGTNPEESRQHVREVLTHKDSPEFAAFLLAQGAASVLAQFVADPQIGPEVQRFTASAPAGLLPLRVRMFGSFEVRRGEYEIPPASFGRRGTRQLFKYLLLHRRRPVPREEIVEALWPGTQPARAANVLKVRLSTLRRLLEPAVGPGRSSAYILAQSGTVQFDRRSPHWLDLDEFERFLARDDPESLAAAVDLYRGDLLEEDRYEEWTLQERERYRGQFLGALARLAFTHEAAGRIDAALRLWQRLTESDPCAEHGYQGLIRCYVALGQTAEAVRTLDRCRVTLRRELGIDASAETVALIEGKSAR